MMVWLMGDIWVALGWRGIPWPNFQILVCSSP